MRNVKLGEEPIPFLPASSTRSGGIIPSKPALTSFEEAILHSTSLIDDSAKHLFALMKGLNPREPKEVLTACEVAKQIQNLARVKLDFIKAMK